MSASSNDCVSDTTISSLISTHLFPRIKCPVCQKTFDSGPNVPHVLSCGHAVCSECIPNLLLQTNQNNADDADHERHQSNSQCPTCQHPLTVDELRRAPRDLTLGGLVANLISMMPPVKVFIVSGDKWPHKVTLMASFSPYDQIRRIDAYMAEMTGLPQGYMRLVFSGKLLSLDKTLSDYKIGNEMTIHILPRLGHRKFW